MGENEYVFDSKVMNILDGKDLVITIVAHDDHGFAHLTVAIVQPDDGKVVAMPHSQVLRAGNAVRLRIPMPAKPKPAAKKRGHKKTAVKKDEKSKQVK